MSAPAPSDTKTIRVGTLEGKPVYGGELEVKLRVSGDEMILLEIFYAAGVGTPLHSHTHESVIYLVSGKLKGTIDGKEIVMLPGDTCRHPRASCTAWKRWRYSVIIESKSPAPDISAFMGEG